AQEIWDDELWHDLATRGVRIARETGALSLLPNALNYLAAFHVHAGAFAPAATLVAEIDAITRATGLAPLRYADAVLSAESRGGGPRRGVRRRGPVRLGLAEPARARRGLGARRPPVLHRDAAQQPRALRRGVRGRPGRRRLRGRRLLQHGLGRADRGRGPR